MSEPSPWITLLLLVVTTVLGIGRWVEARQHSTIDLAKDLAQQRVEFEREFGELRKRHHDQVVPRLQQLLDDAHEQEIRIDVLVERCRHYDKDLVWLQAQINARAGGRS